MVQPTVLQLVNEREAARILGLSVFTLQAYRFKSRGPAYYKMGKAVRYHVSDLQAFIDAKRVTPEAA